MSVVSVLCCDTACCVLLPSSAHVRAAAGGRPIMSHMSSPARMRAGQLGCSRPVPSRPAASSRAHMHQSVHVRRASPVSCQLARVAASEHSASGRAFLGDGSVTESTFRRGVCV